MKKTFYGFIVFLVAVLFFTNPSMTDFERYVQKGMGSSLTDTDDNSLYRIFFATVEPNKLASRQNYLLFSIYEISPEFISSISITAGTPSPFIYEFANSKIEFIAIGNKFYALGQSARGVNTIHGFLELCRVGAIDCRMFFRKYGF